MVLDVEVSVSELKTFGNLPDLDEEFLQVHLDAAKREVERLIGGKECPSERVKEAVLCMAMSYIIPAAGVGYLRGISSFPQDMMDGAEFEKYAAQEIVRLSNLWRNRARMAIAPCINSPLRVAA